MPESGSTSFCRAYLQNRTVDWLDHQLAARELLELDVANTHLVVEHEYPPARIQDKEKLQVVAGSMRDAFGVNEFSRKAGMIEIEGAPVRDYIKNISVLEKRNDSDFAQYRNDKHSKQGPEANTHDIEATDIEKPRQFALAAASLRQAWKELPEINEMSDNIQMEETPEGLHVRLVDQEGRSMFPKGSKQPFDRT